MKFLTKPSMNNFFDYSREKLTSMDFYFHSTSELIYCTEGTVTIEFVDGSVNLQKGETILISPFAIHRINNGNFQAEKICFSTKLLIFYFSDEALQKCINQLLFTSPFYTTNNNNVLEAAKSIKNFNENSDIHRFLCISEILFLIQEEKNGSKEFSIRKNQTFLRMIDFIKQNTSLYISTNILSEKFELTSSHIGYIFKNEIEMSPITYITNYKLAEASKMLLISTKNIKNIATSCGFNSIIYFQSIFKDAFGITPKQYQNYFRKFFDLNIDNE